MIQPDGGRLSVLKAGVNAVVEAWVDAEVDAKVDAKVGAKVDAEAYLTNLTSVWTKVPQEILECRAYTTRTTPVRKHPKKHYGY